MTVFRFLTLSLLLVLDQATATTQGGLVARSGLRNIYSPPRFQRVRLNSPERRKLGPSEEDDGGKMCGKSGKGGKGSSTDVSIHDCPDFEPTSAPSGGDVGEPTPAPVPTLAPAPTAPAAPSAGDDDDADDELSNDEDGVLPSNDEENSNTTSTTTSFESSGDSDGFVVLGQGASPLSPVTIPHGEVSNDD